MLAVQAELALKDWGLRRIMVGQWRAENRNDLTQSIADLLNNRSEPEQIAKLIATAGRGKEISFTYTKPDGVSRTWEVSVASVSGNLLRARDLEDGEFKSFRIDRISYAHAL
jgi:predicted DNA-binding transcriptional regulator YafY